MSGNYVRIGNLPFNHPETQNGSGVVDFWRHLESNVSSLAWDTTSTVTLVWLTGVESTGDTDCSYIDVSFFGGNETMKGTLIYHT